MSQRCSTDVAGHKRCFAVKRISEDSFSVCLALSCSKIPPETLISGTA